jgi:hypothetical protein
MPARIVDERLARPRLSALSMEGPVGSDGIPIG